MATYTFTFGSTAATFNDVLKEAKLDDGTGAIALGALTPAATYDAATKVLTIPSYGTYDVTTDTFKAAAGLTGTLVVTKGTNVTPKIIDLSAATGALTFTAGAGDAAITKILGGAGADSLTAATGTTSINGGAGDDTITAGVTGGYAAGPTVKGGLGADKFVQADDALKMKVDDYNYTEGDTLVLGATNVFTASTALSATGAFVDNTTATLSASAALANSAYKVKVTDGSGTPVTREYWTAASATSVNLDGTGKTDALYIDAGAAVKAQVTLGGGNDYVTLGSSQVTLTAGKAGGSDSIKAGEFDDDFAGDVLNLKDATLSELAFAAGTIKIGTGATQTTLNNVGKATDGQILVQENGGAVKKVAYTAVGGKMTMTDSAVADVYLGAASTTAGDVVELDLKGVTTYGTFINLQDTAKYKNINKITGSTITAGTYVGAVNSHDSTGATGTSFDLTAATASSQVWGGSGAADTIALNNNGVKDTIWFGTTDGKDVVTVGGAKQFEQGFAAAKDVVNLYDVADLTTLSFAAGTAATDVKITAAAGNTLELQKVVAAGTKDTQLKLMDKTGAVKKVAVGTAAGAVINGEKADLVIGFADLDNQVKYTATQTTDVFVNLYDTAKFKNIRDIDLSAATSAHNLAVGSATLASIINLGGASSEAWGGSSQANTFSGLGATAGTIWFGANDGADVVLAGFAGDDKIKFYDKSISEIATAYKFSGSSFISKTNASDSLLLTGVTGGINTIIDKNNNAAKVVYGSAAAALVYAADAKVYMADDAVAASQTVNVAAAGDVFLYLGNGKDATVGDVYFSNVKAIDATSTAGNTVLCGAAATSDTLTGGMSSSAMWGGGIANDEMIGHTSAVDQFWFGSGDGADKVTAGADKKDTIVLHNITSIADVTMTLDTTAAAEKFTITAKDGSALTVSDSATAAFTALDGGITFQFGADASAKSYTYNRVSNSFVAK